VRELDAHDPAGDSHRAGITFAVYTGVALSVLLALGPKALANASAPLALP
jgi:hypothetical protein